MTYDNTPECRFAPPGLRDEPQVVAKCAWCGREIYSGDSVTETNERDIVHDACEHAAIEAWFIRERGVIGADGTLE
ncbi:hypothetical protein P4H42_03615 [Paenibacillus macerans]|uniref:hypothetical protein n=1 Tax=Paenibacillus macerans TaxID=44252 RepID=UPI002DBD8E85|nr:hypothetical protein [Paenibacillus macerans]MEC0328710.1 hypothetical protein [Paenibacillus macerans]